MEVASRFVGLPRWAAISILFALCLVVGLCIALPRIGLTRDVGVSVPSAAASVQAAEEKDDDLLLYHAVIRRVAAGENYYAIAAEEHRARGYPLKPFVTIRPPTLAMTAATLGDTGMRVMLWSLILATLLVWWRKLSESFTNPRHRLIATMLVAIGMTLATRPELIVMHEIWAGLLILLSLGLHDKQRWWPSLLCGALAVAVRETALPYLLLMAALTLWHRRWPEALGWIAATMGEIGFMVWHSAQVALVVKPDDIASQGWMLMGGLPYALAFLQKSSALRMTSDLVAQCLIPLSLFGWIGWRTFTGLAGALLLIGYALLFMIAGRPENFYWGMLVAPILLIGLAFVPRALIDLLAAMQTAHPEERLSEVEGASLRTA